MMAYKAKSPIQNFSERHYQDGNNPVVTPLDSGGSPGGSEFASSPEEQGCAPQCILRGNQRAQQPRVRSAVPTTGRGQPLQPRAVSAHQRGAVFNEDPSASVSQTCAAQVYGAADKSQRRAADARHGSRAIPLRYSHRTAPNVVTNVDQTPARLPPGSDPYLQQDPSVVPVRQQRSDPYYDPSTYPQNIRGLETPQPEGDWRENQRGMADAFGNLCSVRTSACAQLKSPCTAQWAQMQNIPHSTAHRSQVVYQQRKEMPQDEDRPTVEKHIYSGNVPSEEVPARVQLVEDNVYESDHDKAILNNFEEVEQLVHDEGEDVAMALRLQNQCMTPQPQTSGTHGQATQNTFQIQQKFNQYEGFEESDDEVSPEVAAAMMHSEEQGILMGAAPLRVYNALFSDDEKDFIAVTSAAPFHAQNVVVPASVDKLPYTTSAEDLVALTSSIRGKDPLPSNSIFADNVKQQGLYDSVMAVASSAYVTEPTEVTDSSEDISKASLPSGGTIEYVLDPASPPDHYSRVQLRGSTSPNWFPGYFQALPNIEGITAVCSDPSTVVEEAWSTLQSTTA